MNRFLICTAMGLFLGVTPALAQDQAPQDETMSPPAIQSPRQSLRGTFRDRQEHVAIDGGTLSAIVRGSVTVDRAAGRIGSE